MISHFIQVFKNWKKQVFKNNLKISNIWQQKLYKLLDIEDAQ